MNQPRRALACTVPRVSSRISASRTTVRDTPSSWPNCASQPHAGLHAAGQHRVDDRAVDRSGGLGIDREVHQARCSISYTDCYATPVPACRHSPRGQWSAQAMGFSCANTRVTIRGWHGSRRMRRRPWVWLSGAIECRCDRMERAERLRGAALHRHSEQARRRRGRCRTRAGGRHLLLDGPRRTGAAARGLCRGADLARIPQRPEAGHARQDRRHILSNGPASAISAVVVPWRLIDGPESAQTDRGRDGRSAACARAFRTSISGALMFSAPLFENSGYQRHPPRDRRVGRRRQQSGPARHAGARRGARQGHHHQRPADHAQASRNRARSISRNSTSITRIA